MAPHEPPAGKKHSPTVWKHREHSHRHLANPNVTHVDMDTVQHWTTLLDAQSRRAGGNRIGIGEFNRSDPAHADEFEGDPSGVTGHKYELVDHGGEDFRLSKNTAQTLPNPTPGNPNGLTHSYGPTMTVRVRKRDGRITRRQ